MNKIPRQVHNSKVPAIAKIRAITIFMRSKMQVSAILFFMNIKIFFGEAAYSKERFSKNKTDDAINIRAPNIWRTVDKTAHSWNIIAVVKIALCGLRTAQGIIIMNTSRYGKDGSMNIYIKLRIEYFIPVEKYFEKLFSHSGIASMPL